MWQDELRRQIDATPEDGWNLDNDLAWQQYRVIVTDRLPYLPLPDLLKFISTTNAYRTAGRPRGTVRFDGFEADEQGLAALEFSVTRSGLWNLCAVFRGGQIELAEFVDAKGKPPYLYADFNRMIS
jgi:hypothetical protein